METLTAGQFAEIVEGIKGSIPYFAPELVLTVAACLLFLVDLAIPREKSRNLAFPALAALGIAFLLTLGIYDETRHLFLGMIAVDSLANFFKCFFLLGTAIVVILTYLSGEMEGRRMGEFYGIMFCSVLGMFLMASATNLLMFYLAIEMVSIPSYILVAYKKEDRKASEAAFKYVVYGSIASGVMIYGASFLYGMAGSADLGALASWVAEADANPYALGIACFLMLAGFAYKMAVVPMHFWCPDIYEGAPTPVTAWLSVVSKGAGFVIFIRFCDALGMLEGVGLGPELANLGWSDALAVIAALTMTIGNLGALFQEDMKRLLAYSSIAHAGYIMMGLAAFSSEPMAGWQAVSFYFLAYLFMNLGAFTVVILVANNLGTETVTGYNGLARRLPLMAFCMAVCLFSLIGLPPTGGFVGKLQLFMVVIEEGMIWLAVVAAVNTAISVYYYARILRNMYLVEPDAGVSGEVHEPQPLGTALMVLQTVSVLYLGILFGDVVRAIQNLEIFS